MSFAKKANQVVKELTTKIELSKWGHSNKLFSDEINNAFKLALELFKECGDYTLLNKLINAFSDKNKKLLVDFISDKLPLKYSNSKSVFVIDRKQGDWKVAIEAIDISSFTPLKDIKISKETSSGIISVDKTKMDLPELHSFMLDAMALCRNNFSEEQVEELFQTISRMHKKRIKCTD